MIMRSRIISAALGLFLVAASQGTVEVVKTTTSTPWIAALVAAIVLTAITFIIILLAFGMRNPLL